MGGLSGVLGGCAELNDPSTPCPVLELGEADPATMVSRRRAPVLAMAGGSADPFVLHFVCEHPDDSEQDCTLTRSKLPELVGKGENAVLVTSAGDYIVATDRDARVLRTYKFESNGGFGGSDSFSLRDRLPVELLTSLRNSNWIIGLDQNRRMVRYMPTENYADLVAEELPDVTLAAVGEHHIIGRVRRGVSDEELYLIPIDEELEDVHHGPSLLMRGRTATRIVIGPRDEHVAITLGHGDTADTLVFRIPDGSLIDRFAGEMVSGREDLTELVGMRAVSPDGSHLAYKTAAGSIALRDVDTSSACLVRSASAAGEVRVAGFSAEGTLYFESEVGIGNTTISAWDGRERYLAVLSEPQDDATLVAVPAHSLDEGNPAWAIGVRSGAYMALQDSTAPHRLDLHGAMFIPRDDADIWALDSQEQDTGSGRRLGMRRITAQTMNDDAPRFAELDDRHEPTGNAAPLQVFVAGPQTACLSTGTPGARGYACGSGNDDRAFLDATAPQGEDPVRDASPSPEVPQLNDIRCPEGGQLLSQVGVDACDYVVNGCCFARFDQACSHAECPINSCSINDDEDNDVPTIACGTAATGP